MVLLGSWALRAESLEDALLEPQETRMGHFEDLELPLEQQR